MCGLFGYANTHLKLLDPALVDKCRNALNTLYHRGPDDMGEVVRDNVYHGHRRLAIMDLSPSGRQPMQTPDEDVYISVNGEIYNHIDLRTALGAQKFQSHSDSEVVLHGYHAWGVENLAQKLEGMYAIVIHDTREQKIFLIRDRVGVKPMHYYHKNGTFCWASELKAIAQMMAGSLEEDLTALYDYLTYRYIPSPKTFYKKVKKLEPAHILSFDLNNGDIKTQRYWSLECRETRDTDDKIRDTLIEKLRQSIDSQLMSDVPLGFFLSGGMDSSILVSLAAEQRKDQALNSFSIGYDVDTHDETRYAKIVADKFQTNHFEKKLNPGDGQGLESLMADWFDEPFADTSALSTYHVSKFAREHVTVALSGDGGDELFGGYRWYNRYPAFRLAQSPFRWMGRRGLRLGSAARSKGWIKKVMSRLDLISHNQPLELYAALLGGVIGPKKRRYRKLLGIESGYDEMWHFRRYWYPDLGPKKSLQYLDFHTFLPDDILTKVDRVSMAVSLEARVPFLDTSVIEYAFSLPEDFIYKGGRLKGGLKHNFQDHLPAEILSRGKKGFSLPIHKWYADDLSNFGTIEEVLLRHYVPDLVKEACG